MIIVWMDAVADFRRAACTESADMFWRVLSPIRLAAAIQRSGPPGVLSLSLSEVWFFRRQHEIHSIIYNSTYERRSISWLAKLLSAERPYFRINRWVSLF